jgi:hypothetical protein
MSTPSIWLLAKNTHRVFSLRSPLPSGPLIWLGGFRKIQISNKEPALFIGMMECPTLQSGGFAKNTHRVFS